MSKLYDLLYAMIEKLNSSVKTTAQTLTEAEKTQARANIGAMAGTFAPTAESVGADPKGTAAAAVSAHNTNTAAHADIRSLISGLADRLNALANSDDTTLDQMKEVVDYIKDNRELIESVTTNKVNVADIVDNLATADAKKPLSAKQGVELLKLISSSSGSGGGSGVNLDSAEVGQLIVVEAVDSEGQPIKWKAVDRTHYKETIGEDVAVLAETSVAFTNSTATVAGFVAGAIKEGNTYKVNWNGTEYTCEAYLDDGIVHLGNSALASGSVTTDDPFCIVGSNTTCMVFKNTEDTETITLKVDGVAEVVYHKLDGRFLPEGSPYTESSSVEVPLHIEFDGNVSGKETAIVEGVTFVKVSNTVLTKDELVGATVLISAGGEEISVVLNAEDGSMQDLSAVGIPFIANFEAFIAVQSDYTFEGSEFTAGLYFVSVEGVYTKSLSNPNVTVTEETETVHKLDPKYLPDALQFGDKELYLLPEMELTFEPLEALGGMNAAIVEFVTNPTAGEEYVVLFGETEYHCTYVDMSGDGSSGIIGNLAAIGAGEDTGEPFVVYVEQYTPIIIPVGSVTTAMFSIRGLQTVPIAQKYAPGAMLLDFVEAGLPSVNTEQSVSVACPPSYLGKVKSALDKGSVNVRFNLTAYYCDSLSDGVTDPNLDVSDMGVTSTANIYLSDETYPILTVFVGNLIVNFKITNDQINGFAKHLW